MQLARQIRDETDQIRATFYRIRFTLIPLVNLDQLEKQYSCYYYYNYLVAITTSSLGNQQNEGLQKMLIHYK